VVLGERFVGDRLELRTLRGARRRDVTVELAPFRPLVPRSQYDREPTWFIFGGLVFQVLSRDYLRTWNKWWDRAPKEFLHLYYSGIRRPERQEVVILTQILADEINVGFAPFHNEAVVSLNGAMPVDMRDFVRRVDATDGLLEIKTSLGGTIVLETRDAREAGPRILARYHVPADRTPALRNGDHRAAAADP
jgi:hypothetical protein